MSQKTKVIAGIVVVVLAAVVAYASSRPNQGTYVSSQPSGSSLPTQATGQTSTVVPSQNTGAGSSSSTPADTYTLADVAAHNSASSCWTAINGNVYDVTSWINQHPGGPEAILSLCGTDGSAAFNAQHGGQRQPASELATFKIGTLAQ